VLSLLVSIIAFLSQGIVRNTNYTEMKDLFPYKMNWILM